MAFSMSLSMAYQRHAAQPATRSRPKSQQKRREIHRASQPSKLANTTAPSVSSVQQLSELPSAVACDAMQEHLSPEAQLIQARARESHEARQSALSDRESLRCLNSLPLHAHISRRASAQSAIGGVNRAPSLLLPKYYPPRRARDPADFDDDAPQTSRPTNSSGEPLKSIDEDADSFSDDSEVSGDDDFFLNHETEAIDHCPVSGVSIMARLEAIRIREAAGSSEQSSISPSLPTMLSVASVQQVLKPHDSTEWQHAKSKREEIEEWLHIEDTSTRQADERDVDDKEGLIVEEIEDEVEPEIDDWYALYESDMRRLNSEKELRALFGLEDALMEAMEDNDETEKSAEVRDDEHRNTTLPKNGDQQDDIPELTNEEETASEDEDIELVADEADDWLQVEDSEFLDHELASDEY